MPTLQEFFGKVYSENLVCSRRINRLNYYGCFGTPFPEASRSQPKVNYEKMEDRSFAAGADLKLIIAANEKLGGGQWQHVGNVMFNMLAFAKGIGLDGNFQPYVRCYDFSSPQ